MTDEDFHRSFSKALAQALIEKENEPQQRSNQIRNAYVALCHDEPQVESDEACASLAKQLTLKKSEYKLSERLVEGVLQATSRTQQYRPDESTAAVIEDDLQEKEEETATQTSSLITSGVATGAGYAFLAVAVFAQIPLQCCESTNIKDVETFLGSYRSGRETQNVEQQDTSHPFMGNTKDEDDDSLAEVFAEESDPDDFEYESGFVREETCALEIDPIALSRPIPSNSNLIELRKAISSLLIQLSYSKMAPLTNQQFHSLRVADTLTQLAMILLVPPEKHSEVSILLKDEDDDAVVELRRLGVQPLFCLRDRANLDATALHQYIVLIQSLLGVDAIMNTGGPLAPATVIAMASLSELCQSPSKSARSRVRNMILENLEDLSHIIERSIETDAIVSMSLSLLPLLETITGIQEEGKSEKQVEPLQASEAQIMLNSGFFRNLISLLGSKSEQPSSGVFVRQRLLRCILVLCHISPNLLGKYAWRVPQLSQMDMTQQLLDSILWFMLGYRVLSCHPGDSGRLRLRNSTAEPTTLKSCQCKVQCNSMKMLENTMEAMLRIQQFLTESNANSVKLDAEQVRTELIEFCRFCNLLASLPFFATQWVKLLESEKARISQLALQVKIAATNIPSVEPNVTEKDEPKKTADNDKAGTPRGNYAHLESLKVVLASMKPAVKIILLVIEDADGGNALNVSSKTD